MADVVALDFSDLIHSPFTQSPSPDPPDDDLDSELGTQPIHELELNHIRNTLKDMGYTSISKLSPLDPSNREHVLAAFVLRLTHPGAPLASQVIQQAETIAQLSHHIQFLSECHSHDRELWEAEREASARLTDAILRRARKDGLGRVEDLERDNNTLLSDNRILRNRLQDTQSRLASLEAELVALRPYFLTKSEDSLQGSYRAIPLSSNRNQRSPRKSKDRAGRNGSDEETTVDPYPLVTHKHNAFKSPTTGDARIEHMLLAARKLGRERVARLAPPVVLAPTNVAAFPGVFLPINAYVPPVPSTPQTPKRTPSAASVRAIAPGTPISKFSSGFGILPKISPNPYMRPNAAANYAAAAAAVHVPSKVVTATNSATSSSILKATNSNGLENLLSAAKRVFDPDAPSSSGGNPSKKRRVDQQSNGARETSMVVDVIPPISSLTGQAMSALDVLADQAAAFGPEETDGSNSEGSDEPASTHQRPPSGTDVSRPSGSTAASPTKKPKSTIPSRSGSNMLPSYSTYLPDYKSMLSNGPLPPAPDYSSPFGPRSDAKGKSKALLFPTTPSSRPGPVITPYALRPSTASTTLLTQPSPPPTKRQPGTSGNPRSRNTPNPKSSYSPLPLSATRSTSAIGPRESSTRKAAPTSRSSDSRSSVSRSRSTSPITMHRNLNGRSIHTNETLGGRRSLQEMGKVGLLSPKEINIDTSRPTSAADTYSQEITRPLGDRTTVGTENFPLP